MSTVRWAELGIVIPFVLSGCNMAITPQSPDVIDVNQTSTAIPFLPEYTATVPPAEATAPFTWMSVDEYATAANGTAIAVATEMPPEMPKEVIGAYHDFMVNRAFDYSVNGTWYYNVQYGRGFGGSVAIETKINDQEYVVFSLSGHQLSLDGATSDFSKKLLNVDLIEGKPLVIGKIESIEVGGEKLDLSKAVIRSEFNPETGEDWGFILIRKADINNPKVYEGALKTSQISYEYPSRDNKYANLCKPGVTNLQQVAVVNAESLGQYQNSIRISHIRNSGCSGSGVFYTNINNEAFLVGPVTNSIEGNTPNGDHFMADESLIFPIFWKLGQVGFEQMLKDMASKFQN